MLTSVITKQEELEQFLAVTEEELGDASAATCLLAVPWMGSKILSLEEATVGPKRELRARWDLPGGFLMVELVDEAGNVRGLPVPVEEGGPVIVDGQLQVFGMKRLASGVYALNPSLNMPGVFHGYVVMHGVPEPPPWERRVLLT